MSKFMTDLLADLEADAAANMPNLAANIADAQDETVDPSECDCRFHEDSYSCTDCGTEVV